MTVAVPDTVTDREPGPSCTLCGRPMAADQEWCLECGAARTVIARAPDWRLPLLVVGGVVALVVAGLVLVLTQLGSGAGRQTVIEHVTTHGAAPTTALAGWAPGLDGYTVILAAEPTQPAADATAARLPGGRLADVGVLATAQHPQMRQTGDWDVFAGRYPTYAAAQRAATAAVRQGHPGARPALVQRPGQG